jgi:uncharacterized membrane protein
MNRDPYKWGIFYFDPQDNRVFVPKKIPWAGITVNFANPLSYLFLFLLIAIIKLLVILGSPTSHFPSIFR